jgi:hypothetical protein
MKTVSFYIYRPWGTRRGYTVDLHYGRDRVSDFEGDDLDALLTTAKAWALIQGFTHYKQQGERHKL